jgi:hypothetical protein
MVLAPNALGEDRVLERKSEYPGPQGEARFLAATADGSRVFFGVVSASCPQNVGHTPGYIYERSGGTTTLVSTGADGQPHCATLAAKISDDGSRVFFGALDRLAAEDTDSNLDLYERSGGTTRLVTTGPTDAQAQQYFFWVIGNPAYGPAFSISNDGSRVFFVSNDSLVASDGDTTSDVYERSGGTTTLVSVGPGGMNANAASLAGITADGSGVFFNTDSALAPQDANVYMDIYERAGGTTNLVTNWPHGGGIQTPTLMAASPDGSRLILRTASSLVAADTDSEVDLYSLVSGQPTLLSTGTGSLDAWRAYFTAATPDTQSVWFHYTDAVVLTALYENSGGTVQEIPVHDPRGYFSGQAGNGAQTFFGTSAQLAPEDTDSRNDIYRYDGFTTTLISTGPSGGNGPIDVQPNLLISTDGSRVFFMTAESLVSADTDSNPDVYERQGDSTTLISSTPSQSPRTPFSGGLTPDGATVWFTSSDDFGTDTNGQQDVYESRLADSTGYARPRGATPIFASLVPAFQLCTVPGTSHGSPLAFGSCAPPAQTSSELTVGTADSNGKAPGMIGWVAAAAIVGDPATAADEADVQFQLSLKDIRRQSDLEDYTGEVKVQTSVRLTDKDGGVPSTTADFPISFAAPCTPTASTSIGSTCAAITTADSIAPGSVVESARAIWAMDRIEVYDGGNVLFAAQGVFVP